jgi:hypothetical protein
MEVLSGQKLAGKMITDLTSGREEFLNNVIHEGTARPR